MQINWTIVVSALAVSPALFGALAWLTRSLITHFLSRDVERFKSQLQLSTLERQIRFSQLHEKQATVVAQLYQKLLHAKFGFQTLRQSKAKDFDEKDRKIALKVLETCLDAFVFSVQNELYFEEALFQKISEANLRLMKTVGFYTGMDDILSSFENVPEERRRILAETLVGGWRDFEDEITPLLEGLKREFRSLLGSDKPGS